MACPDSFYRYRQECFDPGLFPPEVWEHFESSFLGQGGERTLDATVVLQGTPLFVEPIARALSSQPRLLRAGFPFRIARLLLLLENPFEIKCGVQKRFYTLFLDDNVAGTTVTRERFDHLTYAERKRFKTVISDPLERIKRLGFEYEIAGPREPKAERLLKDSGNFILLACGSGFWSPHSGLRERTGERVKEISSAEGEILKKRRRLILDYLRWLRQGKALIEGGQTLARGEKEELRSLIHRSIPLEVSLSSSYEDLLKCFSFSDSREHFKSWFEMYQNEFERVLRKQIHQGLVHDDPYRVVLPGYAWVVHPTTVLTTNQPIRIGEDGLKWTSGVKAFEPLARFTINKEYDHYASFAFLDMLDEHFDTSKKEMIESVPFRLRTEVETLSDKDIHRAARRIVMECAAQVGDAVLFGLPILVAWRALQHFKQNRWAELFGGWADDVV